MIELVGDFIRTMTIDGEINSDSRITLKTNQTEILGRGSEDYIISLRKSILQNKTMNYRVPEMWDREWNHRIGPIWAPDSVSDSTLQCWLKPEQFQEDTDGTEYSAANDSSSNSVNFTQSSTSLMPDIGSKGLNGFKPLDYNGSHELFATAADGNAVFSVGTTNFMCIMVVTTPVDGNEKDVLIQHGNRTDSGYMRIYLDSTSSNTNIVLGTSSGIAFESTATSAFSFSTSHIITVGKDSSGVIRVDGSDKSASGTPQSISSTDDTMLGMGYSGTSGTSELGFNGDIYEVVFIKETDTILNDVKKIEGYLSAKYGIDLDSGHDYYNNPPRTTVIE